jgi:hypothetical protein
MNWLPAENPGKYHIYEGLSSLTNISRYDLPDPDTYRWVRLHDRDWQCQQHFAQNNLDITYYYHIM